MSKYVILKKFLFQTMASNKLSELLISPFRKSNLANLLGCSVLKSGPENMCVRVHLSLFKIKSRLCPMVEESFFYVAIPLELILSLFE